MEWDRTVLEHLGDLADYVSLHRYVGNPDGDTADYLAVSAAIDRQIEEMDAVCRYVQARKRSKPSAPTCASTSGTCGTRIARWTARARWPRT